MKRYDLSFSAIRNNAIACYGLAVIAATIALYARFLLAPISGVDSPYFTIWCAITFCAWYCGLFPSILTSILCIAGLWYWAWAPIDSTHSYTHEVVQGAGIVATSAFMIFIGEMTRRSERKLTHAKDLFQAFLDNSPTTAFIKDEAGRYVFYNQTLRNRLSVGNELLGRTDSELFHESARLIQNDRRVLRTGRCSRFVEQGADGDEWLSIKFPLVDENGNKLVGGISIDITEQKRTEAELRKARQELETKVQQRTTELRVANEELRQLASRLQQLQDQERRRLARELHDSVGQLLASIAMNNTMLKGLYGNFNVQTSTLLEENDSLIAETTKEIRTISHLLHPPLLEEVGLSSAMRWYVDGFGERSKIQVETRDAARPRAISSGN